MAKYLKKIENIFWSLAKFPQGFMKFDSKYFCQIVPNKYFSKLEDSIDVPPYETFFLILHERLFFPSNKKVLTSKYKIQFVLCFR